jgi:ABC-type multidrug transport system ATPase subunit
MLMTTVYPQTPAGMSVLQVTGLSGGPAEHTLFNQLDLCLPEGVSALLGDEGSGKTTLLRLLAGDLMATSGQMRLLGMDGTMTQTRTRSVFWTDLRLPLHDENTPEQCWRTLVPHWPNWSEETQKLLIDALQLTPHLDKRLNMLSTGSRRKVGLVAALASGATVTLLDQPFVSLDRASIKVLQEFLREASQEPHRAWVIADYVEPAEIPLAAVLQL